MKFKKNLFLLLMTSILMQFLIACEVSDSPSTTVENSAFQEAMLEEVNYARTKPADYAEKRLKSYFSQGKDNGAYNAIKNHSPVESLKHQGQLCKAASKYAKYMADHNVFGHNKDRTPKKRCEAQGYDHYAGENIACGSYPEMNAQENAKQAAITFTRSLIIDEGVPSLGHRKNIMNKNFTHFGSGFYRNTSSTYHNYIVQDFGREK